MIIELNNSDKGACKGAFIQSEDIPQINKSL